MSLNKAILMGRMTADPEMRSTNSGKKVTSFTLAVNRNGKDAGTDFIDIVAWRGTAEFASKYFTKGRMMIVVGRLQIRDWTDKDGGKRRSAEVIAENVYFGDSKKDSETSDNASAPTTGYATAPSQNSDFADIGEEDGELPF